jgi:predicted dehydrogenase
LGATGLDIQRNDIYEKELDLITSTSYGPGRYDQKYEEIGLDYPYDYVRWTENRNMAEYLRMLDTGTVNISSLITKKYDIDEVEDAFDFISNPDNNSLLVVLSYRKENTGILPIKYPKTFSTKLDKEKIGVGIVGVSSFLKDVHLPNLLKLKSKFEIKGIYNRTGYKSEILSNRYKTFSTSDIDKIIEEPNIDLVFITTAHGDHANNVIKGLRAGKHIFVEKPLATSNEELELIKNELDSHSSQMLMVGYNRRFSPYIKEIKNHCKERKNPMIIQYRMNAGYKNSDSSAHDFGGRIIGECCHIVDLCSFLVGHDVTSIYTENITPSNDYYLSSDNKLITIKYSDGSIANIQYFSIGSNKLSKENMEVHFDGKSIIMDNYKSIKGYGLSINNKNEKLSNKGHYEELIEIEKALKSGKPPISVESLIETSSISIQLAKM